MDFDKLFAGLTNHQPFPWQKRLYEKFCKGEIPSRCDIPTGLGKTSVVVIWLLALAGGNGGVQLPRRLVYVVNRRTIVDQATEVVEKLKRKLKQAAQDNSSPLNGLVQALRPMCTVASSTDDGDFLAVGTLRGELADNLQWRFDPMRLAVMIGTVDMIGSKLLFSGYGDSRRVRPLNAGIVGCDTLIVHDEAHLTPAFSHLLRSVEKFQKRADAGCGFPTFQVLELSATSRNAAGEVFEIGNEDKDDLRIKERLCATKRLHLHKIAKSADPVSKIVELALSHSSDKTRVVIFVQSPETAENIHKEIAKEYRSDAVSILTGEIRGYERDKLLNTPGMLPFTGSKTAEYAVYLVSTSAGEVGMDLHADHMVSDLSTLDSMIQRLGRVNRFGQSKARVDVVCQEKAGGDNKNASSPVQKTLALLERKASVQAYGSGIDVSPLALNDILNEKDASEAFASVPDTLDTTDILLDLWSHTSLDDISARPEVAPWLHGIKDDLPETWIAWRKEIEVFHDSDLSAEEIARWFQKFPIASRETLRKPTHRLKWKKDWIEAHKEESVFVLLANGQGLKITLEKLNEEGSRLNFATIIFPPRLGGLNESGFLDFKADAAVEDVADGSFSRMVIEKRGERYRIFELSDWQRQALQGSEEPKAQDGWNEWSTLKNAIGSAEKRCGKRAIFKLKVRQAVEWEDEPRELWLVLLKDVMTLNGNGRTDVHTIEEHNKAVLQIVESMANKTTLSDDLKSALCLAALHHDLGKAHDLWQTAAGHKPGDGFAKPLSGGIDWRMLSGYRHELGSVLKAKELDTVKNHPERDLILHLIAAHHGWARPHFEESAFPPEVDEKTRECINVEIMKRYIALQERFGFWRLAWLESLLRRADGIASMQYGEHEEASDE